MELHFLEELVIVYGIGALIVYLFQKIHQSPIVGFLVTGVLVGPHVMGLIYQTESVETLAELGVMLLLFSLGLEFSLQKLLQMSYVVFGTGPLQVGVTVGTVVLIALAFDLSPSVGVFAGFLVALSSTAIVLRLLVDRGEIDSIHGRVSLGILIFQDLCVVPMMVVVPLLAGEGPFWIPLALAIGKATVVVVGVMIVARYLFPVLLQRIVETRSKELFMITSIFMLLGTAWVTSAAGLSLALGAFLAGLILSESEYSHQIFANIRPFRDSLNSLFFISIGMLVDPAVIWEGLGTLGAIVSALIVGKALIAGGAIALTGLPIQIAILVGLSLAQIGEFSFILLEAGSEVGLIEANFYQLLLSAAVVTMLLTPLLAMASRRLVAGRWPSRMSSRKSLDLSGVTEKVSDHVIICGFGLSGRNIAAVLKDNSIPYIILELNAHTVKEQRQAGEPIYYGDCTDPEILAEAGISEARVLMIVISDPFSTRRAVGTAKRINPELIILARSKYMAEIDELYELGATEIVAEEFESSLELLTRIMRIYHFPRELVASQIRSIREQRYERFRDPGATVPRLRLSEQLDIYTETLAVETESPFCHRSVAEIGLRKSSGVLILGILRKDATINNPGPEERILPGDLLVLSGTKEQLNQAMRLAATRSTDLKSQP